MRFRQDINALRGVAVALVALFHFQTPGFNGGFIGVDVFFLI
jgi:peptidoglycan/LPS O-acetylase OafA/YrhL